MSRDTLVRDVMTTDVLTLAPDGNVREAMQALVDRGVDAAPVVDAGGRVVGMLSTADLILEDVQLHAPTVITLLGATLTWPSEQKHFEEDLNKALGASVAEVMTKDPVTCNDDDTIEEAATLLHDHDVSRLPVLRGAVLVGIVARKDVLRAILTE